ncbi:MAG TPA: class I SAM-dependent methyltransferase [Pyrinomonadaceae bacterium]
MRSYVQTKPEQVKFFEQLISPYLIGKPNVKVLDACCGIGDLTYFLSQLNPDATFVGIDRASFLIAEANKQFEDDPKVTFRELDVNFLSKEFGPKEFDLAVCKQTISWLPDYKNTITELMAVTRDAVFISSLFYDGRIDFEIRVREHVTDVGKIDYNAYYNVYSFPVFRDFCLAAGARDVVGYDFNIQIDLPRPTDLDRMGTYTVRLDSGDRLQISGALLMPWKIVRIDL